MWRDTSSWCVWVINFIHFYEVYCSLGVVYLNHDKVSLLIPGLGQIVSGEVGRGVGFFVGEFASLSMFVVGFGLAWGGYDIAGPIMAVSVISAFTIPIWSSVNAVRIAKVKNMEWSDKNRLSTRINLSPGLKLLPNQKVAPAITLSLNF